MSMTLKKSNSLLKASIIDTLFLCKITTNIIKYNHGHWHFLRRFELDGE